MDAADIGTLVGYIAGISVATERVVEIIKGIPAISSFLAQDQKDPSKEQLRVWVVHILAIVVGSVLTYATASQLPSVMHANNTSPSIGLCLLLGAMSAGGSGLWNSALDIVREVNKAKQKVTDLIPNTAGPPNTAGTPSTARI